MTGAWGSMLGGRHPSVTYAQHGRPRTVKDNQVFTGGDAHRSRLSPTAGLPLMIFVRLTDTRYSHILRGTYLYYSLTALVGSPFPWNDRLTFSEFR